jgi:uncharacterized protein YegP (UPF0339 family)
MKRATWSLLAVAVTLAVILSWPGGPSPSSAQEKGMTFEVYKDRKEEFRWRLKAANGNILATSSEGYKAKADCQKGIEAIKTGAATAKVEDLTAK